MSLIIFTTPKDHSAELILDACKEQSVECIVIQYGDVIYRDGVFVLSGDKELQFTQHDRIILRDPFFFYLYYSGMMRLIAQQFHDAILLDKKCIADFFFYEDKLMQAQFFKTHNAPHPATYYGETLHTISAFPVILKQRISSRGVGTRLIDSQEEFDEYVAQNSLLTSIAQRYHPATADYRVTILNGTVLGIAERTTRITEDKGIRVKVSHAVPLESFPSSILEQCSALTTAAGADLVGMDVIKTEAGQYYFIEMNITPQFKSFSRVTEVSVATLILEQYKKDTVIESL